ncbi:MAG: hypothetical protein H6765_06330 [Candidatus Peribacteria bacterium]|nr:MAG: hypothetical protein H6765_06330 [Candidatus Peribacteria bacterium]
MVVTRFAPSPTGSLHIGSVRTALFSYLIARKYGGKYILRIEDTDVARSTKVFEQNMLDGFERVGLEWDAGPGKNDEYGPYYQMERLDIYNQYLQTLLDAGLAYYAWETAEELEAMREAAAAAKKAFNYRRVTYTSEQIAAFQEEGRKPVVRLQLPEDRAIVFHDAIK